MIGLDSISSARHSEITFLFCKLGHQFRNCVFSLLSYKKKITDMFAERNAGTEGILDLNST